jgi:hypothetical protein
MNTIDGKAADKVVPAVTAYMRELRLWPASTLPGFEDDK